MVISGPATFDIEQLVTRIAEAADGIRARLGRAITGSHGRRPNGDIASDRPVYQTGNPRPALAAAPDAASAEPPPPVTGAAAVPPPPPLTERERRARLTAVRGLMFAREQRYAEARATFVEAARLDPALDLTAVPTFWHLPRGGQEAAVGAYEDLGRLRDAAALAAALRHTLRPQRTGAPLRPSRVGVTGD